MALAAAAGVCYREDASEAERIPRERVLMKDLALIGVLALIGGGQLAKAAPALAGPGESSGLSPEVERQVSYVRGQLGASGFKEVPGGPGAYRFEGNAPELTVILLEPKQPGATKGSLAVMAAHAEEGKRPKIRQSRLTFGSSDELAAHLQVVRAGFAETHNPVATAPRKCPFASLVNMLVARPSRTHAVVQVRQAQPLSLGSAEKATLNLGTALQSGQVKGF